MATTMRPYEVPHDGQWHLLEMTGPVLHVDSSPDGVVELWALHDDGPQAERGLREFRVFGVGETLPRDEVIQYVSSIRLGPSGPIGHVFARAPIERTA